MSLSLLIIGGMCVIIVFGVLMALLVVWMQNRDVGEQAPTLLPTPLATRAPAPADLEAQIRALLERGNKIEAIKVYRAATGLGLKESKDAVEAMERGGNLLAPADDAWSAVALEQAPSIEIDQQVRQLLRQGMKLQAIKVYRDATGAGLKEAKDAVEVIERDL